MNYIEINFCPKPNNEAVCEVLMDYLADLGFDSFINNQQGVYAYILANKLDGEYLDEKLQEFPLDVEITYTQKALESVNWNEEWEKTQFQPIAIDKLCLIQGTQHNQSAHDFLYNVYINPKMAFGSGHHQTTTMMIRSIIETDIKDKTVLDMGSGTGILSILSSMHGAKRITAIDIDEWSYNNTIENSELNNMSNIKAILGDAKILNNLNENYNIILANINRNILLEDIQHYTQTLNKGGTILLSGFYVEDIPLIIEEATKNELKLVSQKEMDNWACLRLVKTS